MLCSHSNDGHSIISSSPPPPILLTPSLFSSFLLSLTLPHTPSPHTPLPHTPSPPTPLPHTPSPPHPSPSYSLTPHPLPLLPSQLAISPDMMPLTRVRFSMYHKSTIICEWCGVGVGMSVCSVGGGEGGRIKDINFLSSCFS